MSSIKKPRAIPHLPSILLMLAAMSAVSFGEQPPAPCHANPQASLDVATVGARGDVSSLPNPLKERLARMASRPDGTVFTFATWGEHEDTLLPRADHVAFAPDGTAPFLVAWSALAREVDLVPVAGLRPDRYRLPSWPPAPVMERLRAVATPP